jgi:predicted nucleic acid-binding protein
VKRTTARQPSFVLDTSVSASWILPTQATPYKIAVLDTLENQTAVVPALWHLEMANIVCKHIKKMGISAADSERLFAQLESLALVTDEWTQAKTAWPTQGAIRAVANAALTHRLTSYDAQYLQLALRRKLPLATCDEALCAAAQQAGIPLFQPY